MLKSPIKEGVRGVKENPAQIQKLPHEISVDEFLNLTTHRSHFNIAEINRLNVLFGDHKSRVFGEPSKVFTYYDFSKNYWELGKERIQFKGYIVKRKLFDDYLLHTEISYTLRDISTKRSVFFQFEDLEQFIELYVNLPKIIEINVGTPTYESKILSFKDFTTKK
jgi:hypothetical protein